MPLAIHLLGSPTIEGSSAAGYQVRSRKSWALLAYLLLSERPPTRTQLASLLYSEADDPLRALRWNLSEIRRALGEGASLEGDPLVLELPADTVVDVRVVATGSWPDAMRLPALGRDLLEGFAVRDAAAFATWLLSEQRHFAAAAEAILHEAALGSLSRDRLDEAVTYAARAAAMSPLDENHQALLIRLYRLSGDVEAAQRKYQACVDLFQRELGVTPGAAVVAAVHESSRGSEPPADPASIEAVIEASTAAIAAGAAQTGLDSLRAAVRMADRGRVSRLRLTARLVLAEALIHSLGGLDEEGLASLHEADAIAMAVGDRETAALARAELGYVDFLRGRYDRAEHWLAQSLHVADGIVAIIAKATTYLGCVESDRADYARALVLLEEAVVLAQQAGDPRREAFATSMIGRIHLLRGDLDHAGRWLDTSIDLATGDHWLAFLPWPQALRGEVQLATSDVSGATESSQQAFARACQLGDPCWEGIAARVVAMSADASGDVEQAFAGLIDARARCNRLADPYVWLDAYILDALCELGLRHGHPDTPAWIGVMRDLTARTGMRELEVRSLWHSASLGDTAAHDAAIVLSANIDNGRLATIRELASG
jgi:DNA-binding SARP family transcriptional activator